MDSEATPDMAGKTMAQFYKELEKLAVVAIGARHWSWVAHLDHTN